MGTGEPEKTQNPARRQRLLSVLSVEPRCVPVQEPGPIGERDRLVCPREACHVIRDDDRQRPFPPDAPLAGRPFPGIRGDQISRTDRSTHCATRDDKPGRGRSRRRPDGRQPRFRCVPNAATTRPASSTPSPLAGSSTRKRGGKSHLTPTSRRERNASAEPQRPAALDESGIGRVTSTQRLSTVPLNVSSGVTGGRCLAGGEGQLCVEPPRFAREREGPEIGASRPLRRIPAIVSFPNPQPALSLLDGNRSSCP
jgi:hypothetical protein